MLETLGKNLWTLITIILPGLCTYGIWRLLLVLNPSEIINPDTFDTVDQSSFLTGSIVVGIALLQQIVGLLIEFSLYIFSKLTKNSNIKLYTLFYKRFEYAKKGKLNTYSSSVIGNFFLSINVFIGLGLILCFFMFFENLIITHWIPLLLILFMSLSCIVIFFRLLNAIQVVLDIE